MSEDYKKHIVFDSVNQLENKIKDNAITKDVQNEYLKLILSTILYFRCKINNTNPIFLNDNTLNSLNKSFQDINSYLITFINQKNQAILTSIKNSVKTSINTLNSEVPYMIDFLKDSNISDSLDEFRSIIHLKTKEVEQKYQENIVNITNKNQEIIEELEKNKRKIIDLNEQIVKKDNYFNSELSKLQENFKKTEIELNSRLYNISRDLDQKVSLYIEDNKNKVKELIENINKRRSSKNVKCYKQYRVTGNYQKTADCHRNQANFWRYVAIFLCL